MHRFLRAVGFSRIKERKDLDNLLGRIMNQPDKKNQILISPGKTYTEFSAYFTSNTGIRICGEYDEKGFFFMEHYYPFCESRLVTSTEDVTVNKRVDTNAFTGMCDDPRLGISMIFYLQNAIDYLAMRSADNLPHKATLTVSGLFKGFDPFRCVSYSRDSRAQTTPGRQKKSFDLTCKERRSKSNR